MIRVAFLALCLAACGRSKGVADQDLGGLVIEPRKLDAPIDLDLAARDPAELGRALAQPYRMLAAVLGPHTASVSSATTVDEAGKRVSELSDHAVIEIGESSAYHAVYTNSADYGRETTFINGRLYLRPRYQRWHARPPEGPDEALSLRDQYFEAVAATWDLLAPGAELTDRGAVEVAGRAGKRIEVKLSPDPRTPPVEAVAQRKWREHRTIEALTGEVVLDADRSVPLSVKLAGTVAFSRDGRRFAMKVSVDAGVSGIGNAVTVAVPPEGEVVATPERLREVDDRDTLLQGIAPPLRKTADAPSTAPAAKPDSKSPRTKPDDESKKPSDDPANHRKNKKSDDGGKP